MVTLSSVAASWFVRGVCVLHSDFCVTLGLFLPSLLQFAHWAEPVALCLLDLTRSCVDTMLPKNTCIFSALKCGCLSQRLRVTLLCTLMFCYAKFVIAKRTILSKESIFSSSGNATLADSLMLDLSVWLASIHTHNHLNLFKRYLQVFMQLTETEQKLLIQEKHIFSMKYIVTKLLQLNKTFYLILNTWYISLTKATAFYSFFSQRALF